MSVTIVIEVDVNTHHSNDDGILTELEEMRIAHWVAMAVREAENIADNEVDHFCITEVRMRAVVDQKSVTVTKKNPLGVNLLDPQGPTR